MDQNPLYDVAKADVHSHSDVAALFVRDVSPIWIDLQHPINHIVVGARGTGKTMALRQLDFRTLVGENNSPSFVGLYTHLSRISAIFSSLFDANEHREKTTLTNEYQQVFADYLVLEIVRNLCDLADSSEAFERPEFDTVFRLPGGFDAANITVNCTRLQMEIETSIQSWQISGRCTWRPLGDLPTVITRLAHGLRRANEWLEQDQPCLYLLLDESSPVPEACQSVLNNLLLRGQPYCVKLAVRPFEWTTSDTQSGHPREQNTDYFVLHLDGADELNPDYVKHMERMVDKVLHSRDAAISSIRRALPNSKEHPYSGFEAICAASSGNPQDILLICSAIFAACGDSGDLSAAKTISVPPQIQHDVVRMWSHDFSYQNAYEASRRLCRSLARLVKKTQDSSRSIGFEFRSPETSLFESRVLPNELAKPLRPAFAGGYVRAAEAGSQSLFEVPATIQLSRGALPELDVPLETPATPSIVLDHKFIESNARVHHAYSVRKAKPSPVLHLASSFMHPSDSRYDPLMRALRAVGFEFPKDRQSVDPSDWIRDFQRKIRKADFALVGNKGSSFRKMMEIGLCAGAHRPVDVIVGKFDERENLIEDTGSKYGHIFPTVTLQPEPENFNKFAAEFRALTEQLTVAPSEFSRVALTGVSLRPQRKREKTVYLSIPKSVIDSELIDRIRARLEDCKWSVITEEDMTSYRASKVQVPVLCAHTARVGVIDTSMTNETNAIQAYKLALFAGKRGWRALHTIKREPDSANSLESIFGTELFVWNRQLELVERIVRFVAS